MGKKGELAVLVDTEVVAKGGAGKKAKARKSCVHRLVALALLCLCVAIILILLAIFTGQSDDPTVAPTTRPTVAPTDPPTQTTTDAPTTSPTFSPTSVPTESPTFGAGGPFVINSDTPIVRDGDDGYVGIAIVGDFFTPSVFAAFERAAVRWSAIVRDTQRFSFTYEGSECGGQMFFEEALTFPDLLITARVAPIDGVGQVLGRAGPCAVLTGTGIATFGLMEFDSADLDFLETEGVLEPVILHEMAHVLGVSSGVFNLLGLIANPAIAGIDPDGNIIFQSENHPTFTGGAADARYRVDLNGAYPSENGQGGVEGVPLENGLVFPENTRNSAGRGSLDSHLDEEFAGTELMNYRIDEPERMLLSVIIIGILEDLGYNVDYTLADNYTLPFTKDNVPTASSLRGSKKPERFFYNDVIDLPIAEVDMH